MLRRYALVLAVLCGACGKPGNLGEDCKPDGTCNSEALECTKVGTLAISGESVHRCELKTRK